MKLKANSAVEALTLGKWLAKWGHRYSRDGFTFTTPTPDNPEKWLRCLISSARCNEDDISGVQLVGE